MESWRELLDMVLDPSFLPLGAALALLLTVGTGFWSPRWRKAVWVAGLLSLAVAFYLGIERHEWGEVLFNGQLL